MLNNQTTLPQPYPKNAALRPNMKAVLGPFRSFLAVLAARRVLGGFRGATDFTPVFRKQEASSKKARTMFFIQHSTFSVAEALAKETIIHNSRISPAPPHKKIARPLREEATQRFTPLQPHKTGGGQYEWNHYTNMGQ